VADCSALFHYEAPFSLTVPVLPCVVGMGGFIYQEDPEVGVVSGTVYQALGSLGSMTGWSCPLVYFWLKPKLVEVGTAV